MRQYSALALVDYADTRIRGAFSANSRNEHQHQREAHTQSAVSAQYPACIVGSTTYLLANSPYVTATTAQGVQLLSSIVANTLDCRADTTQVQKSISVTGISAVVQINAKPDVRQQCQVC
jgi:hypothetical protein